MATLIPDGPFVSAEWLAARLQSDPSLRIIDATWLLPSEDDPLPEKSIKGAKPFDIGVLKERTELGAAFDDIQALGELCEAANITPANIVVIYDRHGLFSAPRAWWTLGAAGYRQCYVLKGGLPEWLAWEKSGKAPKGDAELGPPRPLEVYGATAEDVKAAIGTNIQIIDARSSGRFHGLTPEPREGMKSGHIPGSLNLPFSSLKDKDGQLKSKAAINKIVTAAGFDGSKRMITTCGSGVTAAALAMIFEWIGMPGAIVYSGSWKEWGAEDSDFPLET